ncbi:GNAT family N-acetyltransferase [Actinorugispora endophytica]|uniref:Putative N-acetyltransferase YhbS n=1 Tax=Actinorugispora endophytica TaxID=1605990 RepID=A0A4R6UMW4_9ACTN|nr:GNAT family N-acetyltransferase [Actinorugispora endophytica]TDQ47536.1 putative N-acetyltransferase YhbS [Actinorugispora endophytica]
MSLVIRPFRPDDAPAVLAITQQAVPHMIDTVESLRARADRAPAASRAAVLVAELDGIVVGRACAELEWETSLAGQGAVNIVVDPGHRRRGVGGALLRAAEKHIADVGGTVMRTYTLGPESGRFAEHRGYERGTISLFQELDLASLPPVPPRPEGAELRPYRDFRSDPRPLHAVEGAAARDEPAEIPYDATPYPDWLTAMWEHPLLDLDLSTAAVLDGRPVCVVNLFSDGRTKLYSAMTGTLREYRGRGLVKYTKAAALHRARERGYRTALTSNADDNAPMRAVNTWLGYRQCAVEVVYAKPVPGVAS